MRSVLLLTLLLGLLPLAITHELAVFALAHGGRSWPDWLFAGLCTVLHFGLIIAGAWVFTYIKW